jgi:hypothetical protein
MVQGLSSVQQSHTTLMRNPQDIPFPGRKPAGFRLGEATFDFQAIGVLERATC